MRKFWLLLILYLLVEGDNVVGDGLYVWHRGAHAVEQLEQRVDEYGPKVTRLDSLMGKAIEQTMADSTEVDDPMEHPVSHRPVIYR